MKTLEKPMKSAVILRITEIGYIYIVTYGFVFSPEFMGQGMTNEEFVASMYRALLGREPDEAGFKAWVETLNGIGTYTDIFYCFLASEEFSNLCASYGIEI